MGGRLMAVIGLVQGIIEPLGVIAATATGPLRGDRWGTWSVSQTIFDVVAGFALLTYFPDLVRAIMICCRAYAGRRNLVAREGASSPFLAASGGDGRTDLAPSPSAVALWSKSQWGDQPAVD